MAVEAPALALCVKTLVSGCPAAFREVFELGHREPVVVDPLSQEQFAIPPDRLAWLTDCLIAAEVSARAADYRKTYAQNLAVADYFEAARDTAAALRFHSLALTAARASGDPRLEAVAYLNAARARRRLAASNPALAREVLPALEAAHALTGGATAGGELGAQVAAALAAACRENAAEAEATGATALAAELYERAARVAADSGDAEGEGVAWHRLGLLAAAGGDIRRALDLQRQYLRCARAAPDVARRTAAEGRARAALATLQAELGNEGDAADSLARAALLANAAGDATAEAETCSRLGALLARNGAHAAAAVAFERVRRVAIKEGDAERSAHARVLVGLARGNAVWSSDFAARIVADPSALLTWRRAAAAPPEIGGADDPVAVTAARADSVVAAAENGAVGGGE